MELARGKIYSRRADLLRHFGGQQQGGIVTPRAAQVVLLFSSPSGLSYGYHDTFQEDGTYWYTGEGQRGEMTMTRGNLAILEHEQRGRVLELFEQVHRGHVRYQGQARYLRHHHEPRPDVTGAMRSAIVFELELLPIPDTNVVLPSANAAPSPRWTMPLDQLRKLALASAPRGAETHARIRLLRVRSDAIRLYVQRRANGICELCGMPAPFKRLDGRPFLEAHHLDRISDGGPDHPAHVAAICPNCHRAVHLAEDASTRNNRLRVIVTEQERKVGSW